jgi:hypothetical protein
LEGKSKSFRPPKKKELLRRAHDLENQSKFQGRVQLKDSVWIQVSSNWFLRIWTLDPSKARLKWALTASSLKITKIRNSNHQIEKHFIDRDIFSAGLHTRKKKKEDSSLFSLDAWKFYS